MVQSGMVTQHRHCQKSNVLQSILVFWGIRYDRQPVRKLCQSMSSHINLFRPRRYDLGMEHFGLSSGRHRGSAKRAYICSRSLGTLAVSYLHQQTWESSVGGGQSNHRPGQFYPSWSSPRGSPTTPISTHFKTIYLLKADEWAHLPSADFRCKTIFTPCRQRLKRKDGRNTQLLRLNQHDLKPKILPLTPLSCEQLFITNGTNLPHPNNHHTSWQQNVTIQAETFRFKP